MNHIYSKLDVEDPENSEEHKDLLFLTSSTNFGLMPVVPGANQSTLDVVDQKQALFPSLDELFPAVISCMVI